MSRLLHLPAWTVTNVGGPNRSWRLCVFDWCACVLQIRCAPEELQLSFYCFRDFPESVRCESNLDHHWQLCRGGARHFHLGGPLEGPVLQQGELSMVCVGLSERDLKNFGGPGKISGGKSPSGTPLAPPLQLWRACLSTRRTFARTVYPFSCNGGFGTHPLQERNICFE